MKFDFASWFKIWIKALTKPAPATFDELVADPANSTQTAYLWMAIAGAIAGLFAWFGAGGGILTVFVTAAFAAAGLAVDAWIVNLFATKVFKGSGNMNNAIYAFATFAAPMTLVNGVLMIIPVVGSILSMLIGLYTLVLSIFATQSVYKLETGKAAGAVLLPAVILIVIVLIVVAIFTAIGIAAAGVFSGALR